jgi:hypothetical protein
MAYKLSTPSIKYEQIILEYSYKGILLVEQTPLAKGHTVDEPVGGENKPRLAKSARAGALLVVVGLHQLLLHELQIKTRTYVLAVGGRVGITHPAPLARTIAPPLKMYEIIQISIYWLHQRQ